MTDGELVRGLQRGDPAALDRLIACYGGPVLELARVIVGAAGGREDAEEAAADAFARAWQRRDAYDPSRATVRSWLLMHAKYAALDRRRQLLGERYTAAGELRVVPLQSAPEPVGDIDPVDDVIRDEQNGRLYAALGRLPAPHRELLMRRYLLEESIAALASAYGITRQALDTRLSRARRALQAELGALEAEAGEREEVGGGGTV